MEGGRDILQGLVAAGKPSRPAEGTLPQSSTVGCGQGNEASGSIAFRPKRLKQKRCARNFASRETTQVLDPGLFTPSIVADPNSFDK